MDKLSADKKVYVAENSRMAEELTEIKNLLVGVINEEKLDLPIQKPVIFNRLFFSPSKMEFSCEQ